MSDTNAITEAATTLVCLVCGVKACGQRGCADRDFVATGTVASIKASFREVHATRLAKQAVMDIPAASKVKPGREYPVRGMGAKA